MPRPSVPTRRADILRAAQGVFNARGFAGARMEDVARAAGLSKAALYLQFASKQELFQALVTEIIEATLPDAAPTTFGALPAPMLIQGFITRMAERLSQPDVAFVPRVIIGEGANFPDLARFYHDHVVARGMGVVEAIIRHGVARGEFANDDPQLAARTVIGGLLIGAVWKMVFEPVGAEAVDPARLAATHARTVLNGLLTRKDAA